MSPLTAIWQAASAALAMMSIFAEANTLEGRGRQGVLDHLEEVASAHAGQRKLVRSERPIWKIAPVRREEPYHGRFPDDDDDNTNPDPYAGDPASAHHPQSAEPPALQVSAGEDSEVRQEVNGSTPACFINVGTPEKKLYVILDTGSDKLVAKTWATIQKELRTIDGGIDDAVQPSASVFNRDTSSTYVRIYANASTDEKGLQDLSNPTEAKDEMDVKDAKDAKSKPKQGFIAYGSGVAITEEGQDTVKVGGRDLTQFPISEIAQDSLSMLHTKQGIAGILGLQHMKNGSMGESFFTRARSQNRMHAFSYCRGDNNDGTFIWGDKAQDGHKIDVLGQIHWAVDLGKVKMVSETSSTSKSPTSTPEQRSQEPDNEDIIEVKHGKDKRTQKTQSPFSPFQPGGDGGFGGMDGSDEAVPWFRSSLLQKSDADGDPASTSNALNDPELKEEIGKIVGDIIDKVVEKIEKKKSGNHVVDKENAAEVSSNVFCGENEKCTAILDTGSNIIAGPSDGIKELTKFAKVSPDCSNFDTLPHLHLNLGGDFKADLPPKAYIMQVKLPKWAHGADPTGGMGDGSGDPMGDMGDGSGPGADGGEDGMDGMEGMDGMLGFARHRSKKVRAWYNIVKRLYTERGVDLSHAMRGVNVRDLMHSDQLCMPAFVPLDKHTTVGKLWVVGTPLFEQYYSRWSWAKDDTSPSVFLADKHTAKACVGTAAQPSSSSSKPSGTAEAKESTGLLRHERAGKPIEFLEKAAQRPPILDITDIRYPHWARALSGV